MRVTKAKRWAPVLLPLPEPEPEPPAKEPAQLPSIALPPLADLPGAKGLQPQAAATPPGGGEQQGASLPPSG